AIVCLTYFSSTYLYSLSLLSSFFFFHDPAPTEIYTLSLHDALPICSSAPRRRGSSQRRCGRLWRGASPAMPDSTRGARAGRSSRSEEHTSELQSRFDLVCRLLLEKKKKSNNRPIQYINTIQEDTYTS